MMIGLFAMALGMAQDIPSAGTQSPTEIANATAFALAFRGERVTGCTITATSGDPHVDHYICEAARSCAARSSNEDRRAACLAKKREELAELIAKKSLRAK